MTGQSAGRATPWASTRIPMGKRCATATARQLVSGAGGPPSHNLVAVLSTLKTGASYRYSRVGKEGVAVITQAIHNGAGHWGAPRNFRPVEADPADWAEQQQSVPLLEDEYPHARDHVAW